MDGTMHQVSVQTTAKSRRELEEAVDVDIQEFDRWFTEHLENIGLSGPEKAIIKTYLGWKFKIHEPTHQTSFQQQTDSETKNG